MAEKEQLKQNLQNPNQWRRILYMLLFWIVLYLVMMVTGALILIQVLFALITGSDNENLRKFSADLTKYINQIILFLTYNENRKPFPFAAWGELEAQEPPPVEEDILDIDEVDEHESIMGDAPSDDDKPAN
ncbi:MAG: DUF4389 domain-containing protein [Piscirickettsiaceae bacterium]|nr:DUF4389 domain-containing protein [Piscirickettsiaceae bacterium]